MALVVKNLPANAGDARDTGLNPESGRSPAGRHGNPLQYSCLENPMDRGPWWAASIGSQRVGHYWVTHTHTHTQPCFRCLIMDPITSSLSFTLPLLTCINSLGSNVMKSKFILTAGTCMELSLQSTHIITFRRAACESSETPSEASPGSRHWTEQRGGRRGLGASVPTVDPCRHSRQPLFLQKLNA